MVNERPTLRQRAQTRWRRSVPDQGLTWDRQLSGDPFIEKAAAYGVFRPEHKILEVGPGYGRLLRSILNGEVPFAEYLGVEISQPNLEYLRSTFPGPSISFLHGDIETIALNRNFDVMLSSLTFKHFYPSFEPALANIGRYLSQGGTAIFDLLEGHRREFRSEETGYIRHYSRADVEEILTRTSFELLEFDEVQHDADHVRLLVISQRVGAKT